MGDVETRLGHAVFLPAASRATNAAARRFGVFRWSVALVAAQYVYALCCIDSGDATAIHTEICRLQAVSRLFLIRLAITMYT
jgi:hypothetical protein